MLWFLSFIQKDNKISISYQYCVIFYFGTLFKQLLENKKIFSIALCYAE